MPQLSVFFVKLDCIGRSAQDDIDRSVLHIESLVRMRSLPVWIGRITLPAYPILIGLLECRLLVRTAEQQALGIVNDSAVTHMLGAHFFVLQRCTGPFLGAPLVLQLN